MTLRALFLKQRHRRTDVRKDRETGGPTNGRTDLVIEMHLKNVRGALGKPGWSDMHIWTYRRRFPQCQWSRGHQPKNATNVFWPTRLTNRNQSLKEVAL